MSAVTALFYFTLMFVVFVSADQKLITAESGQDVTLTCRAPNSKIRVVQWSRTDLGDEYVLLYRDGHFVPFFQHPSFKNRVDLQDRQMKDGDVSLILKNVTINDAGTYECRVFMEETLSWKSISIIYLRIVDPPGQTGGQEKDEVHRNGVEDVSVGLIIALSALAVLLVVNISILLWMYKRKRVCKTYTGQGSTEQLYPSQPDSYLDVLKMN